MLQHFTGDIQRQILRIDKALHKAEVIRQQVCALFHNEHAGSIQLQTLFVVSRIIIHRRFCRDKQQCVIRRCTLCGGMDNLQRVLPIVELLLIEAVVFFCRDLVFILLPQRHHTVEGLHLKVVLIFVLRTLLRTGLFDLHADGVADIIGILLHERTNAVCIEELAVLFFLGVLFDMQNDLGAVVGLFALADGIAVRAVGLPAIRLLCAIRLGFHAHVVADHKRGIETHAELTDDVDILVLFVFRLEFQRAALCDDAEVLVKLLLRHADAVIADTQRAAVLIRRKEDLEVVTIESRSAVRQGFIVKLIDRVARVGDQLAQKNLLMGINRVDHEIKKSF